MVNGWLPKSLEDYAVHFHALWLLSLGYEVEEIAELLSFSPRWVRALIKRYNEGGAEARRPARPQRNEADDPDARGADGP